MKKLIITLILFTTPAVAAEQCQVFTDGTVVCYPVGGSSTYGK